MRLNTDLSARAQIDARCLHSKAKLAAILGTTIFLSGCVAVPLDRIKPVVQPPTEVCTVAEPTNGADRRAYEDSLSFTYNGPDPQNPRGHKRYDTFEKYRQAVTDSLNAEGLPSDLSNHKVVKALVDFLTTTYAEAQLNARMNDTSFDKAKDQPLIDHERVEINKHKPAKNISPGEMKDFAGKLFDLEFKPGAALLSAQHKSRFALYFSAFYSKDGFFDRMGTESQLQITTTVADPEIQAAETVFLEFLIDTIDKSTPVMGSDPTVYPNSTTIYPAGTTYVPTEYTFDPTNYIQLEPGSNSSCGITQQNIWVLRDLVNGASTQASAVGGLVTNSWGGFSAGIAVLNLKFSVGDNQTLSNLVKTAASEVALRATLAASYAALQHVKFNVSQPPAQ